MFGFDHVALRYTRTNEIFATEYFGLRLYGFFSGGSDLRYCTDGSGGPVCGFMASASIKMRKVVGKRTIRVTQGDRVQLNWQTDEKVELHLHGIDQKTVVLPGVGGTMRFTAEATGRFPVTSHGFGNKAGHHHGPGALMYVEVYPK